MIALGRPPTRLLGRPLPRDLVGWRLWLRGGPDVLIRVERLLAGWMPTPAAAAMTPERHGSGEASSDGTAERDALVRACLEALDLLGDDVAGALLGEALAAAGVEPFDPTGERFSPERHHAVRSVPPNEEAQAGLVAQTVRAGYRDRGRVVRLPHVLVYEEMVG